MCTRVIKPIYEYEPYLIISNMPFFFYKKNIEYESSFDEYFFFHEVILFEATEFELFPCSLFSSTSLLIHSILIIFNNIISSHVK